MTQPKLEVAQNETAPDPFNVDALRLDPSHELGGVRKLITTIPVRKPHKQEWVRVHPGENYRANVAVIDLKAEREFYLVMPEIAHSISHETVAATIYTVINRQRVLFLWPVRLQPPDGRINTWYSSAHECAELAMKRSTRVQANMHLGAYEATEMDSPFPENDPVWPDLPFVEMLSIGFRKTGRFVDNFDHPIIKQLRGLA